MYLSAAPDTAPPTTQGMPTSNVADRASDDAAERQRRLSGLPHHWTLRVEAGPLTLS